MRNDREVLGEELADSKDWDRNRNHRFNKLFVTGRDKEGKPLIRAHPFSAHERNAFFVNGGNGESFADLSAISGVDHEGDSRCFGLLDFDRDGDQDFAMVNANAPSFELYETEVPVKGNFLAIQLEGGMRPGAVVGLSNRDAIGTRVVVESESGLKLTRVLQAGEGFGNQNSKTLIIGLGEAESARSVSIFWPGGGQHTIDRPVKAGEFVEARETGEGTIVKIEPY